MHANTIRLGCGAIENDPGLRVIIHDDRHGWRRLELANDKPVTNAVDFPTEKERIARHRSKSDRHLFPDGKTINVADDEMRRRGIEAAVDDFIASQKTALPGLPGGPPLVPSSPVVSFENGHLTSGQDVLERIARNGKAEAVVLQFGKPGSTFPTHIHLFDLSPNICNSICGDDRKQMLADLQTAGLLHLPFNQIAVRFYLPDLVPKSDRKVLVTFCVSGALSIHTKDANLVSADKMFDRLAVQTLDGKTQIFSISDLTGIGGEDGTIDLQPVKADLVTICRDALTTLVLALATRI